MKLIKIFLFGFLQIFFISMNIKFISDNNVLGLILASLFANIFFILGTKVIVTSNMKEMIFYILGATFGNYCGYYFSILI